MQEHRSSYRQIVKATSLFGGVQFFQIIISIVRSKFVAILLGPSGMGVVGLLTSSTGLITGLTNFGLGTSAVKNISEATATNDNERISTVILVMRRLLWVTGLLGALVTLIFSPLLSEFTFGNKDYTLAFVWISITLLFNQLSTGELVILQALRHLQNLAKANVYGSFVGLLITIPLYYKFGIEGIVPVIIITSFVTLFFSWYFAKKVKLENTSVSYTKTVAEGKSMMVMGFMISLSGLITLIAAYLLRIFINRTGNVADVGFYSAGFTIINTYVGMIFTAMGTDYYPRLSVVASDDEQCKQLINQQSEIALLILAPILIAFLIFVNWAIIILYSSQFLSITGMVYWATMGIFFKAVSWAIAFVFLAKGVGKLYFWNEFFGSIYFLLFSLLGYYYGGLTGLGVSFLISYILYLIQVFFIAKVKYEFSFSPSFMQIFVIQFLLAMAGFAVVYLINQPYTYILGVILIGFSCWYSYKELESRIGVKEIIQGVLEKFKKK
ncbi:MAG: O-antigen translocase [Fermentimonas sp.]|jgi:O-antigen/teichoic acid export membrane protein|nr:O-antigen translocase [Fermentimonas sp.]NLC87119.1 O-antigen translocase [Bacteroidales bacterium]HBT86663.1 O-antigen translocase [Porphyromonadaceae bacterium]MDD2931561.1 O-antigen translocase [Fermentimonas sp.]MDD3188703.1 O-antigen translocase [Fermentimonas sp.]